MGSGYEINCKKCSYTRSLRVGVGMLHSSLEAEIESTSRKEQQTIKQIILGKQNLISVGEGYSIFQCSKCFTIVNKFHIKIIENDGYSSKFQLFEFEKSQVSIKSTSSQVYDVSEVFRTPWGRHHVKKSKFARFSPS